jgi:autotransporter-associated beta strand protein
MNSLKTLYGIRLLLAGFIAISPLPLFAASTWSDLGDDGLWSDGQNWSPTQGVNGTVPGIPSAGTTGQSVIIGPLISSSTADPIILDTDEIADQPIPDEDAFVSIGGLTFNDTTGVEIASDGSSFLTVTGPITNTTSASQVLGSIVVSAGTNTTGVTPAPTYAGGPTGGSLNFTSGSELNVGISQISTTGTVNVSGTLSFTINASAPGQTHTTFGTIGAINATGAFIEINPPGTNFTGTYQSVATLAADTGDFFKLTSGNFAGATMQAPPAFTVTTLTWITSLYLKGILFVEPTAGGNVINSGVVLPIGNDSEFNPIGTAAVKVTHKGGELLTNTNSSTLDTGGTAGAAYSTTNTIGLNTTGGTIAATTGTTATYGGIISNGNGSTGGLTIGDGINNGGGTVVFSAANTYGGGTTISTGTLQLSGSGKPGATTGPLTLSGGTLALGAANQTVGAVTITGAGTIQSTSGTLTGTSYTDSASAGTVTVSAVLAGTGSLTQSGTGTLVLSGTNSYSGTTTVSSGTLVVTGSTASGSAVTVGNGATLAGTGTINGSVTTTSGSVIAPGATPGTVGTLNLGSLGLTIVGGSALDMTLNTSTGVGGANNDLIKVNSGTLTLSGTTTVNFNALTSLTVGTAYTLISGATTISGFNAAHFNSTGLGSLVPTYSTSAGSLLVTFKNSQTINFTTIGDQSYSGTPIVITLSATSSTGATPVTFAATPSGIAKITNGTTLTISGPGTVTVTASQAGNSTTAPATATQIVHVTGTAVGFSAWETSNGFTAANGFTAGETGPTDSAFNDGLPNLLKYLYDIDPTQPLGADDWAGMPMGGTFTSNGTQFITLTYRQYAFVSSGAGGVIVNVQTSPDLQTWTTLTPGQTPTTTTYTLQQVGTDATTGDPIMQVEATYTGAVQFIRLNASQP